MASDNSNKVDAPDAFQVQAYSVVDRIARNPKPLYITGGLVIALLVGGYAYKYFSDARSEKLQNAIGAVDSVYEGEVKSFNERRESLEKQRDTLVAKQPAPAEGQAPIETPEIALINAQIKSLRPDHSGSANKYLEFYKANPKSAEGLAAGLKHAAYIAEKGDLDNAKAELGPIIQDSKKHGVIHVQALLLQISIEEDKGDFDSAIKLSDEFVASAGAELLPKALLTKGQAQFLKKDFPAAKTTLEKLVNDHGASPEAERARGLLALIPA